MSKSVGTLPKQYKPKTTEDEVLSFWSRSRVYELVKKRKL